VLFSSHQIRRAYGFFIGKQIISSVLSLGSAVLIAREIGPEAYGTYFICITALEYLVQASQFGIPPFLYRKQTEQFERALNIFFTYSFCSISFISFFIFISLFLIPFQKTELLLAGQMMALVLPVQIVAQAYRIFLEKHLQARSLFTIELSSQLAFLIVGGFYAFKQSGYLAPVLGFWAQSVVMVLFSIRLSVYRPSFCFAGAEARALLHNGAPVVLVSLVYGAQALLLTFVTSLKLGVSDTGELGLVRRIISRASFLQSPNTRLSNIICGNHVTNQERLRHFISSNLYLNTLAFGSLFLILAWTPSRIFETILGTKWKGVHDILPWLSFAAFINSSLYVLNSVLVVLEAHRPRLVAALFTLGVLAMAAATLMPLYGIKGWAMAEAAASITTLFLLRDILLRLGHLEYAKALFTAFIFGSLILLRAFL